MLQFIFEQFLGVMNLALKLKCARNVFYGFILRVYFYYKPPVGRGQTLKLGQCRFPPHFLEVAFLFQGFQ